jgi:predicted RND superfamily exporter protein
MKTSGFVSRYADLIIRRRLVVLLISLLTIVWLGSFVGRLGFDGNYRIWFEEGDPYLVAYDRFVREFGNDDSFMVAFEDEQGILREAPIAAIQRLTTELWQVTGVNRVDSLSNFQATRAVEDGISVEDLFPDGQPIDTTALQRGAAYIQGEPLILGSLLSANQRVAIIRAKFAPTALKTDLNLSAQVYEQLQKILDAEAKTSGYRFHIAGGPITDEAFNQVAQSDMGRLLPLLLLLMIVVLGISFCSVWGVLLPVGIGIATIVATLGINGMLDFKLNSVTATSPQLMLGLAIATSMHLLSTFFDAKRRGESSPVAARLALVENFSPIIMTNIATALGFASFMVGNVVPITRLGFVAAVGSTILTILSLTVVPALLTFYPKKASRFSPLTRFNLAAGFARLGRYAVENSRKVIIVWLGATALFAMFIPNVVVDSNPALYFKPGFWFRDAVDFVEQRGSGGAVYEIVVRGAGEDSVKTVEYMRDLDRLTQYLQAEAPGDFRNVYSLATILRNINRSMHADDPAYHVIPEDNATIAQYLLLYSLSVPVGQDINDRVNVANSASRITVVRPLVSTRDGRRNMDAITAWSERNLEHAKVEFTGRDVLYTNMGNNVTDSLIKSLGFDVLTILPLLILMFRSFTAGIVSVFANVGPLVIVLGFMAMSGIMLDVGTLMVAALGLGIAVDDTVHLLAHYFKYRRSGTAPAPAAIGTMTHIGTPAALTTLTLTIAFLVFLGAQFEPNFYFGLLISAVITLALLADITLTPALLYFIDSRRERRSAAAAAPTVVVQSALTKLQVEPRAT